MDTTTERDLTRYYALLQEGRAELALLGLTAEEAVVLVAQFPDGLGVSANASPVGVIGAHLTEAEQATDDNWTARTLRDLRSRIRTLSLVGQWALVDAIEQALDRIEGEAAMRLLVEVGLVSAETAAS